MINMFIKNYNDISRIVHILDLTIHNSGSEFIRDIIIDVLSNNNQGIEFSKNLTCDIIRYGISSNKFVIRNTANNKIHGKSNYLELLKIVYDNFEKFKDLKNVKFPYLYEIHYTEEWIEELKKMDMWDK